MRSSNVKFQHDPVSELGNFVLNRALHPFALTLRSRLFLKLHKRTSSDWPTRSASLGLSRTRATHGGVVHLLGDTLNGSFIRELSSRLTKRRRRTPSILWLSRLRVRETVFYPYSAFSAILSTRAAMSVPVGACAA